MPKKTKKQKIIAQYRKKIKLLETTLANPQFLSTKNNQIPSKETVMVKKGTTNQTITSTREDLLVVNRANDDSSSKQRFFFIHDFKKSLLLTLGIITLEIIFYFATINNYLKLK